jgi:glycosyltransferase involved in cell wall biosynthesis
MRIAVVHNQYRSVEPSGENVVVDQQISALRQGGHEVLVVSPASDDVPRYRRAVSASLSVLTGTGYDPTDQLLDWRPDVVHIHNLFPFFSTRWLDDWDGPLVATLHNYRAVCAAGTLSRDGAPCTDCLKRPTIPAVQNACYRNSRIASVPLAIATRPGGSMRQVLRRSQVLIHLNEESLGIIGPLSVGRSVVIPNFVAVPPVVSELVDSRRRGWVYAGRFTAEKGIGALVKAWPPGERLDVFGGGPLEDLVVSLAKHRPNVVLRGMVSVGEVRKALANSRGLILPSLWGEGLPTVVLESLSMGTPVVISGVVSISSEMVAAGAAAAFDPADSVSLRTAMERVSVDPSMRANARQLALNKYSAPVWLAQVEKEYVAALRQRKGRESGRQQT